jgi:hypothetical protein
MRNLPCTSFCANAYGFTKVASFLEITFVRAVDQGAEPMRPCGVLSTHNNIIWGCKMLKLRGVPDLEESNLLVRLEHRVYAPWQAAAEGHDGPVNVLVDVEALAGKPMFTEQISAALIRHRQLIEQLANALYKPGDLRVFVDSDQLTREVENAVRNAP